MIVSATEFKSNLGRYLELVENEEIIITRNGKRIAKLVDAKRNKTDVVTALRGILPADVTKDEAKEGRLAKHEGCS